METFDLVVIGAGPGGYPAAIRAAQLGAKVVLVEKEKIGGTCLNWGCIPTKALIASAAAFRQAKNAAAFGVRAENISFDYADMVKRKDGFVNQLRDGVAGLLKANGVTVIEGAAAFDSAKQISVGSRMISSDKFIIATGSTAVIPNGIPSAPSVYDNRSFLSLTKLPPRVIVLGGGIIGSEFACLLAALGVKVTVVEMLEDVLLVLDQDVRRVVKRFMEEKLGITILTGKSLTDVKAGAMGVSATAGDKVLEADALLVACGRRPVTEGLGLEKTGVALDERGRMKKDAAGRTSVPGIVAIGDVTGGIQLAHAATSQGLVAAENFFGGGARENETVIPACIFTLPEVGAVGLSEAEAKQKNIAVEAGRFPFAASGKALVSGDSEGFAKLIADAKTKKILGAVCVGPHATELIAEATLAVRLGITVEELAHTVHSHPTLSEVWCEAAEVLEGHPVHTLPKRKIVRS